MRKALPVLTGLISVVALMAFNNGDGGHETMDSSGGPAGYAGDPASSGKTCGSMDGGCHTGPTAGILSGVITSNIPPAGYTPGGSYTVTANFVRPGHSKFGFEISPQKSTGTLLGTLAILSSQTKLVGSSKYITHTSSGTAGSGSKTWSFKWTAPAAGQGSVTFYGAFNATNSNNSTSGDSIFRSTLVVTEALSGIHDLNSENFLLTTFPNPTHGILNVKFTLFESSPVEISLMDLNGRTISRLFSAGEMNGEVSESFDISAYPPGVYYLRLNVSETSSFRKLVKL